MDESENLSPTGPIGIEGLGKFLASSPKGWMGLSRLDGFLTGIVAGPREAALTPGWSSVIWGGERPTFDDALQGRAVLGAIKDRYFDIESVLVANPDAYRPILRPDPNGGVTAADWAEGFSDAIRHYRELWEPLLRSPKARPMLGPILRLRADREREPLLGIGPEEDAEPLAEASPVITARVAAISAFWWDSRRRRSRDEHERYGGTSPMVARPLPIAQVGLGLPAVDNRRGRRAERERLLRGGSLLGYIRR